MGCRRQGKPERLAKQLHSLVDQQKAKPRPAPGAEPGSESALSEMGALGLALAKMNLFSARPLLEKALAAVANQAIVPDLVFAAASLESDWALDIARRALSRNDDGVDPELYIVLGLGGETQDVELFLSLQPQDALGKQALCAAMGILGVPEFVPRLIERLGNEKDDGVRLAAANALQRITGAGLRETGPEPRDELSEQEPDEESSGEATGDEAKRRVVERTSTDPQAWAKWWAEHGRAFSPTKRTRLGRPFELSACVEEARGTGFSQQTRTMAMQELMMRSAGHAVEFGGCEPDEYIEQQLRTLSAWRKWCVTNQKS